MQAYQTQLSLAYPVSHKNASENSSCQSNSSSFCVAFALQKNRTELLGVASNNRQRNVAFKTVEAVVGAEVQAVDFQGVDGGFDGGVLLAGLDKFRVRLALAVFF